MHEIGMLEKAAETISNVAVNNNVERIKYVTIEVGELSGALPQIFKEYFPIVQEHFPVLDGTELLIKEVPSEGLCQECYSLFNILKNNGCCPNCNSRNKKVLGGTEVRIRDIAY